MQKHDPLINSLKRGLTADVEQLDWQLSTAAVVFNRNMKSAPRRRYREIDPRCEMLSARETQAGGRTTQSAISRTSAAIAQQRSRMQNRVKQSVSTALFGATTCSAQSPAGDAQLRVDRT